MSIEQRQEITKIVSELQFHGRTLSEIGCLEGINVNGNEALIVLNIASIKNDVTQVKELIRTKLEPVYEKIKFIETSKREADPKKDRLKIPGVKKVILISSGKGGVGKTTITYHLAKFASANYKVGILDADIYGPSIPVIANIGEEPKFNEGRFSPVVKEGIAYNSIGFMIPDGKAMVWRGPMITKAIHKLFLATDWGELDYLFVDMPPGTGDIHLTILEKYHVDQVVMVTTPSKLAEADVSRAKDMYNKLGVGAMVEVCNMAYLNSNNVKLFPFGASNLDLLLPVAQNPVEDEDFIEGLKNLLLDVKRS